MTLYTLDENNMPMLEIDVETWGKWFEKTDKRIVAQTKVGRFKVSTVFLGVDHNFLGGGSDPILWETMILDKDYSDVFCKRYASRAEAEAGHDQAILKAEELVRQEEAP